MSECQYNHCISKESNISVHNWNKVHGTIAKHDAMLAIWWSISWLLFWLETHVFFDTLQKSYQQAAQDLIRIHKIYLTLNPFCCVNLDIGTSCNQNSWSQRARVSVQHKLWTKNWQWLLLPLTIISLVTKDN